MTKKEELLEQLGESYGFVEQAVNSRIELAKIKLAEKSAVVTSSIITLVVLGVLLTVVLFCLIIAAGFGLTKLLGSPTLAFLLLAGIFSLMGMVIFVFRKAIITNRVTSFIIQQLFSEDE